MRKYFLLALIGALSGFATARAEVVLDSNSSVDQVLDALHDVGQNLKDFTADVKLTETDNSTADSSARGGKVLYQLKADGDARLRVTLDQRPGKNLVDPNDKIEYLLDKGWLVDRNYRKKIEVNRQVRRPGEKIDLFKLGEGPFPMPIGQEKQAVTHAFDVQKIDDKDKSDVPSGGIHVQLKPKTGTPFARKFSKIDVWVDSKSHLPLRIDTLNANETTLQSTELSNIQINTGLKDGDFILPKIDDQTWDRHDEPFSD